MKKEQLELALVAAEQKVRDLKAQLASTLGEAFDNLPKAGGETLMGSAAVLSINKLGGGQIVRPVAIRDGLTPESVLSLQRDVARSFESATLVNPAMAALVNR